MEETSTGPAIYLESISKTFGSVDAVIDCTLQIERGAFVSLLGPSGCGKTTLLRIIGGFETQDVGKVYVHGKCVDGDPPNKRYVNTVFQRYALFPQRTVADNIGFPLEIERVSRRERKQRVAEMLDLVGLPGVEDRTPDQLSGGQAQRVALARALVGRPQVLLLDEPLAALDRKLRKSLQLQLRRIQEEVGTTFLYVTHDQEEALTMSDTIVVMNAGRVVQQGTPEQVYRQPASTFAADFIGETNLIDGVVTDLAPSGMQIAAGTAQLVAPNTGAQQGESITLSIRPERLVPAVRPGSNGLDNRVQGIVRRRIFLGNLVRSLVEISPDLTIMAQCGEDEADLFVEGEKIELGWARADAVVLPPDSSVRG